MSSMTPVHAALQDGVRTACEEAGRPVYLLAEQPDYKLVYAVHCKKSVSRADSSNSDSVHLSMTADDLIKMCHLLLGSEDKEDVRNLAMMLYQFATVSRGDDVRPRTLDELMVRFLKSVGECGVACLLARLPACLPKWPAGGDTCHSHMACQPQQLNQVA